MTTNRKKRMSMLDDLAAAGPPAPQPAPMMTSNRALRSARDAVDSHTVWELDPAAIVDDRPQDRLEANDIGDLVDAIEANGQTVPILVRRHPTETEKYLLVYGRRRLAAIRESSKVEKVRALVASMDDDAAVKAQISENMARRDLSYIEKALFALSLVDNGFGTQAQVAEVLTVTKSSVSMALTIAQMIGAQLIQAIGPAHGVGRPRWESLGKGIEETGFRPAALVEIAEHAHASAEWSEVLENGEAKDPSVAAFEAVFAAVEGKRQKQQSAKPAKAATAPLSASRNLSVDGKRAGVLKRSKRGLSLEIQDGAFADWVDREADAIINDLHARWKSEAED